MRLFFLCFLCSSCLAGLTQMAPADFLATAFSDTLVSRQTALLNYRTKHPQTIQYLKSVELRTETDEFILNQQRIGLRFVPANPYEVSFLKKYETVDQEYMSSLVEDAVYDALKKRYALLVKLYALQKKIQSQQALQQWQAKKNHYLETLFKNNLNVDLKDLVQSIRKQDKIQTKQEELQAEYRSLLSTLKNEHGIDSLRLEGYQWISIPTMEEVSKQEVVMPLTPAWSKLVRDEKRYLLEQNKIKKETWNVLDFVQARWRNRSNDGLFRENFSIGAGIRLPYSGERKRDINQSGMDMMQTNLAIQSYRDDYERKKDELKNTLVLAIKKYQAESTRLKSFEAKFDPQILATASSLVTAMDVLLIEETLIDWRGDLTDLELNVMEVYLDYLVHTRMIGRKPYVNYLSGGLEKVGE